MKSRRRFLQTVSGATIATAIGTSETQRQSSEGKYPIEEIRMDESRCSLWARTSLHVWPEKYLLVSLPTALLSRASSVVARCSGTFAALVLERDEVSLTVPEKVWNIEPLKASAQDGPYRAITFDLSLDLDVFGYFAPAAVSLANARVSIVPQSAYLKDHVLVHEKDLETTLSVLGNLIEKCRAATKKK